MLPTFVSTIVTFSSNGDCLLPMEKGGSAMLGRWALKNDSVLAVQTQNPLFDGEWDLRELRFSAVRTYEDYVMEFEMCNASKMVCFRLAR